MPLIDPPVRYQQGLPAPVPQPEANPPPGALDTLAAAFRQGNIVSSLYERAMEPHVEEHPSPDFNPLEHISGYEFDAMRFIRADSSEEIEHIKQRINSERSDKKTLADAGGWGLTSTLAAGAIDPLTIASMAVPVAPVLTGATRAARIGAGVVSQVALDSAGEVAFHQLQETRTLAESAITVGAGALLTGAFGTVATRVPRQQFAEAVDALDRQLHAPDSSTAGAMRVGALTTLEDESIASGGETLAKTAGQISPLTRLMTAPVKAARVIAQELADVPYVLKKNLRGIATPSSVESRIKQTVNQRGHGIAQELDSAFMAYRKGGGTLTLKKFGMEVSRAMRRGDASDIPEVARVAKAARKVFDADKAELQKLGVLAEDLEVLGAKSYFPRVYDQHAIAANRAELESRLTRWFTRNPRMDESGQLVIREPAEIADAVARVMDNIQGTTRGMADISGPKRPGPTKARVLDVPDGVLEPFLISDFEAVMSGYHRTVLPQIEMRRTFGSTTLERELSELADEFHVQMNYAASNAGKERLRKAHAQAVRDLTAIRDRLLGQTGPKGDVALGFVRAQRLIRSYNYVRLLGGQTLSSLADYGRLVAQYGLVRTGVWTARLLTNVKANRLTRQDAKRIGTALEWTLDTRASTLADIGDEMAGSRVEQIAQSATKAFTRLTLMASWNASLKALASALEQDAVLRAITKGNLTAFERAKLAAHGIGDEELQRIAGQFKKHGETDGLARARTELWDDREAALVMEQAVIRAADVLVLTRGAGDLPILMDSEIAKTILQFKSFGLAAVNRLMIPLSQGLAHRDLASANGLALMLGLGGLTYFAKETAAGRKVDTAPERLIAESLNWSGVLGFLPDLYDPVAGLFHAPRLSRYTDRSPVETALGPSLGTTEDLYRGVQGITDLGVTEKDIHRMRKLLPLQNLFYMRRLVDVLEESTAEAVGAQPE